MSDPTAAAPAQDAQVAAATASIDQAVAEGGAYEVLRKRLTDQGARLRALADTLNTRRIAEFGESRMEPIGRLRIRTENNCIARDIVTVGDCLLFGYNVFIGLKTQTSVADVFALYRLVEGEDGFDVAPVDGAGSFLAEAGFVNDFNELYAYYKHARLLQLDRKDGKLLAAFQIGERSSDVRVFRWAVSPNGEVRYIDNRGERDIALPEPFDFEWTRATREQAVTGRYPHYNILDTVFVETIGGDLTLKIENNTEDGLGVYREPVEDKTQSLDDALIDFARVGSLVLLKVLPYRETQWRGLIYNTITQRVVRNDAIVQACVQLPDDHGVIFPGGYYLQNGEHKAFEQSMEGMQFQRAVRSPNGEDVLYVFYEHDDGRTALFTYNSIRRALQTPLFGHGHARLPDGRMVIFSAEGEPTRVHPMQVWQTPYSSDEFAAQRPPGTSFMGRIGNAEIVRGVSNLLDLAREVEGQNVSAQRYEQLARNTRRLFDLHHWLEDHACDGAAGLLRDIAGTGEAILDEYEKVEGIRRQSEQAMADARQRHRLLQLSLQPTEWKQAQDFVDALNRIVALRGHLLTLRDYRYIDVAAIDAMNVELQAAHESIGAATGSFLAGDTALAPLSARLQELDRAAQQAATATALAEQVTAMQAMAADLDMLSELMATLKVDDPTQRTRIVESLSGIYARLNQSRARAEQRRKSLGSAEAVAQFGAQFTLFGQAITSALGLATDPDRCDEQLSRLMIQLEELESQFGEHEQFLDDILGKREELLETFDAHKQALLDDRQRKARSVLDAANRILDGLARRTERFATPDELNAFFAGDALILKLRELSERLRSLKDSVKADDVEARLKGVRDQAVRALRDRSELFESGGNVIKLGPRHRFSVNTQELDLTLLPRGDELALHLTGTDYLEPLHDAELSALREYWPVTLESESPTLYRGEYLAGCLLDAALAGRDGLSVEALRSQVTQPETLARTVRDFAAPRYREGYEKGIHDHDAALILAALLPLHAAAGPLIHTPEARALALLCWNECAQREPQRQWPRRARNAEGMRRLLASDRAMQALHTEVVGTLQTYVRESGIPLPETLCGEAADYLFKELQAPTPEFAFRRSAQRLVSALQERLQQADLLDEFTRTLSDLPDHGAARFVFVNDWMDGLSRVPDLAECARHVPEAAVLWLLGDTLRHRIADISLHADVAGLLGEHPRIAEGGRMSLAADDLLSRLRQHREQFLPGFHRWHAARHALLTREREAMRLSEFKPRPLSSFVRNRLINDIYLPIIGDNLAKQMGTVGENKRSDLMGLLMLISPPGYGKTTLMEYVAHRLGLIFMKINGPALGHAVRSLDPEQAPDATSRQELEKLNLALEMGNNVMLYVDDIQHTHPEFLQKFISLCDGTRRIEGVWKSRTKTYDMRGKKFCVVMAGNPYTESGELFRIPDMLANRADIYNLGDVLGGMEDVFKLSYIENSLTSNAVLAPLATRDMADVYRLVDKAEGREFSANALSHAYGAAEINEITATLQRMLQLREVVYRVNQQYIASAAQADSYRTEPPFKLQGSYRNMNKLAEKVSAAMNEAELQQLIADHYQGESQLLTTGAEENLLKLGELRGALSEADAQRWAQIKREFLRNKAIGAGGDVGGRVVAQLTDLVEGVRSLQRDPIPDLAAAPVTETAPAPWPELLAALDRIATQRTPEPAEANAERRDMDSSLPHQLAATLNPLLETLRSNHELQLQLQLALADLARNVRSAAPERRPNGPHVPTPSEQKLDRILEQLAQRGSTQPRDEVAAPSSEVPGG